MLKATDQQPFTTMSLNLNPTVMMLQLETGFASKYNVVPSRCSCPPFVAQAPVVSSQGVREVVVWSITAMCAIRLSSHVVVQLGEYDRPSQSIIYSGIQRLQIRITAAWFRPTR
ncbi:hypothetical protein TNCV_652791 [Trichonephila clavipes]|nr:hypothetical protein TNCV_652791 [Trichonephila clavipes]